MARSPINWPRQRPIALPDRGPSRAEEKEHHRTIEPFVYGKAGLFAAPIVIGPAVTIPEGLGATLKLVRYTAALSIGSPHIPAISISFSGRAAYRNLLTDSPYILLPEVEGEVILDLDVPPNTPITILQELVNSTTFVPLTYTMSVMVQYQIEGELWRP